MINLAAAKSKEPKPEGASLRQVYAYVRPHRLLMLIGGLLTLATSGTSLALPLVVRTLITDVAEHRGLATVIILMCLLILFTAGVGSYGNYVLRRGAEAITLATRKQLTDRLLRLTVSSLDRSEPGDLIARATSDSTLLRDAISSCFVGFAVGILTVLATVVIMGIIDWLLLLVTWGALTIAGLVVFLVISRIERSTKQAQDSVGVIGAVLERALGAFRTVKANGAERRESERVYEAADGAYRANVRAAKWEAMIFNIVQLSMQIAFLAALATGGAQVTSGSISVGTLVAFLLYIFFLMSPIGQLVLAITQYQVGAAAVSRIEEVERLPIEDVDRNPAGDEPPTAVAGANGVRPASVEFDQESFKYKPELPEVHHDVSFVVQPGGMTAFVGPSGAGKTTLFSLIERFYEPDSGRVLVDGTDTREWPLWRLRAAIGYVEQDAPVLSGSLRDNLLFGRPEATEAELAEVLRTARLTELTERLPDGLDTQVGHRGTRLSGGERQRVAIARALLRRPRLLLLDEATSQLDAINEAALRETVADVAQRITVLVVAHRLSTVMMADRIIVLDAGRVQAMGTHAELVAANPLYAELAATQFLAVGA
jgi:ABC-type multidrug transport system fused ATPase/permease subunit